MDNLNIVALLTAGFFLASILGYITHKFHLSSILGYLIAGYLIGPYSPGFAADLAVAEQLAEIGVILMMFGVGLHFNWKDLANVKNIAIPGACIQTLVTIVVTAALMHYAGWNLLSGIIFGFGLGVASTLVLVRILSHKDLLTTTEGHIAVGWLIVEDIITVIMLLLLPIFAGVKSDFSLQNLHPFFGAFAVVLIKFLILVAILFTFGKRIVKSLLSKVQKTKSHELFTITILAITFIIAVGSNVVFGTSMALGAFIAGTLIGMTDIRHQVSATAAPLRDAFVVVFFLAIGMLFDPQAIYHHYFLFLLVLAIILLLKPAIAASIVLIWRYPLKSALIIGLSLAQVGEFSFILVERATTLGLLTDTGYDLIVAGAIISIALNPLFFKWLTKAQSTSASPIVD